MDVWWILLFVGLAGMLGGLVNALLSDSRNFRPWRTLRIAEAEGGAKEVKVFWPGWAVSTLLGGVAAALSWALYGPSREFVLVGTPGDVPVYLTLEALASAVVIGIGGARWLTGEVEKRIQRSTSALLAMRLNDREMATVVSVGSPLAAMHAALQKD